MFQILQEALVLLPDYSLDIVDGGQNRLQGGGGFYRTMHFFSFFFRVSSAARVACSNTSRTPSFVLAEHSRYLAAPIFLRTSSACRTS